MLMHMKRFFLLAAFYALPAVAGAQATGTPPPSGGGSPLNTANAEALIIDLQDFIGLLIALLFAVAFLAFIFGIMRYLVAGGANEEMRKQGRDLAIWGIIGFFVMVSVWGLVNFLRGTFGFSDSDTAPSIPAFPRAPGSSTQ